MKPLLGQPGFVIYASKAAAIRRARIERLASYKVRNLRANCTWLRPAYYVVGTLPGNVADCVARGLESATQITHSEKGE